jgi:oxygen-independent coproporphyrinogen III oxidase
MKNTEDNRRPGLYIHIPFCKTKCPYCNFYSTTDLGLIDAYVQALAGEMHLYGQQFPCFDTLYIGGGTPSVLDKARFATLFRHFRDNFSFDADSEVTVEINPADYDPDMFSFLRQLGVNRLNLGVQSFDDPILSFLGRRHHAREAKNALDSACQVGFAHLGLDLIYGVPGQSMESWLVDLRYATAFPVDHLSCYQLTLERGTPLGTRFQNDEFDLPDEKAQLDFFLNTSDFLAHSGYLHYEVSNFAKGPGAMARHNRKYWDHTPYLGIGPAAHSFDGKRRWWNRRSLALYLDDLEKGLPPVEEEEKLTADQLRLETLFLGFRTVAGVDIAAFNRAFKTDLMSEKAIILGHLEQEGLIVIQNGFLRPTLRGMAVADQLALI